jgi:UDP-glucose 4-epimerase
VRVVVIGATGNVGTSVLDALAGDPQVQSVLGLARRPPETVPAHRWGSKVTFAAADISTDDLVPHLTGADVAVHLAWLIQPSRRLDVLYGTNVTGSGRVFDAVAAARVPALVYASSVGAYSPGPKDRAVDESWPTDGMPSSFYARHKAEVERLLDRFEADHPQIRTVRLRPGLIFKREAASGIRRLFVGPSLPRALLKPSRIPVVPRTPGLVFQAVHTSDVAEAYRIAITDPSVRGSFNIAADPVLDPDELGRALHAKPVPVPRPLLRAVAAASWRLWLQPTPPGWVDLALNAPVLDTTRARQEMGWTPRHTSVDALLELLEGLADQASGPTPALSSMPPRPSDSTSPTPGPKPPPPQSELRTAAISSSPPSTT